jgi:hypothetical protein
MSEEITHCGSCGTDFDVSDIAAFFYHQRGACKNKVIADLRAQVAALTAERDAMADAVRVARRVSAASIDATMTLPTLENIRAFYIALSDLHDALARLDAQPGGKP